MMRLLARSRLGWALLITLMVCIAGETAVAQSVENPPAETEVPTVFGGEATVGPAAMPMFSGGAAMVPASVPVPGADRARALDCMSWAIAYEAAGQPIAGQEAVGQVILNRVRDPHRPKTVCGVVFQGSERHTGCQFTFTCDGSLHRRLSDATMTIARSVAEQVLDGVAPDHVSGATNYHANYVSPLWAATGHKVAQIGAHIFYQMPGSPARGTAPVITVGEPEFVAPPPPAPSRQLARAGRHGRPTGLAQQAALPAASHALFQPWGLPVAATPQQ